MYSNEIYLIIFGGEFIKNHPHHSFKNNYRVNTY